MSKEEIKQFIKDMFLPELWVETTLVGKIILYPFSVLFVWAILFMFVPFIPLFLLDKKLEENGTKERWSNFLHKNLNLPRFIRKIFIKD